MSTSLAERLRKAMAFRPLRKPSEIDPIQYGVTADNAHRHREFGRVVENESLAPLHECLIECVSALDKILHEGNLATQGEWDGTSKMKDIAYLELLKLEKLIGGGE